MAKNHSSGPPLPLSLLAGNFCHAVARINADFEAGAVDLGFLGLT
jgi:hypothetical protein